MIDQPRNSIQPAPADAPWLIRFGLLGDMVLHLPLLRLLREQYGQACHVVTSGGWASSLFAETEDVASVWNIKHRHTPLMLSPERLQLIGALRKSSGPVYVSEDSPRLLRQFQNWLRWAGVAEARQSWITRLALEEGHQVDRLLRFGLSVPPAYVGRVHSTIAPLGAAPRIELRAHDRSDRDAWLEHRKLPGRSLILLQAGNKRAVRNRKKGTDDSKAWPPEHWAELMKRIRAAMPEACIVLCGSPDEESMLVQLRDETSVRDVEVAARDLPLRRLLAVLESAHSMISVDTGPAHLAAAVGCPVVVLYGTGRPAEWGRRSPYGRPIVELGGPPTSHAVKNIPAERVFEAWMQLCGRPI